MSDGGRREKVGQTMKTRWVGYTVRATDSRRLRKKLTWRFSTMSRLASTVQW